MSAVHGWESPQRGGGLCDDRAMSENLPTPPTVVAVTLAGTDVGGGLGRAPVVAVATVADGQVTGWTEHQVGWDALHGQGSEGSHHARIVRFVRENEVNVVVAAHLGPPMHHTLTKLGCKVVLGLAGDARAAAVAAVDAPASEPAAGGHHHGHHHDGLPGPVGITIAHPPR